MRLLRNLESVRKNKPLAQSEIRSTIQSLKSRASNMSARSGLKGPAAASSLIDGTRLAKIEESPGENSALLLQNEGENMACCECCQKRENKVVFISEEDMVICQDVSKPVAEDENL